MTKQIRHFYFNIFKVKIGPIKDQCATRKYLKGFCRQDSNKRLENSHYIEDLNTRYPNSRCIQNTRGLRSRMAFPGNQKFPVPSIWEHPLPGPDLVPAFVTALFRVSFKVGKHSGIPKLFPGFYNIQIMA